MICKKLLAIFLLCAVHNCLSKPTTEHDVTQGRGIGSTIWGWITYPFTWWSSGDTELPPVNDQLVSVLPEHVIEIGKHNVTIWCNDQTCTTMKCDKISCRNVTCNIYDTDMTGECREYNSIKPEDSPVPSEVTTKPEIVQVQTKPTSTTTTATSPMPIVSGLEELPVAEERPLELEAVLSSTVIGSNSTGRDK